LHTFLCKMSIFLRGGHSLTSKKDRLFVSRLRIGDADGGEYPRPLKLIRDYPPIFLIN
jgi:hypothetical protein